MKKILYITFKPPYPDNSGYPIRALNIGRALSRKYEVDLLFLCDSSIPQRDLAALKNTFHRVIPFSFPRTRFIFGGVLGMMSQLPLQVEYYYNHVVREWVKEHYKKYDLLFASTIRTTQYIRGLKKKKVVDLIDDLSLSYGEFYPLAPIHWKIAFFIDWIRVKKYHRSILSRFDKIFLTSQFDADHLNIGLESPLDIVAVLPNGVREGLLNREADTESVGSARTDRGNSIVIFGSMNYLPNRDGAIFFAREIFPEIKKSFPDITLEIIGRHPPRELKKIANGSDIIVHGFVDNPYHTIKKSGIVVTPLRAGAGIPNKILEAMALKKANIVSPVAARGLSGEDGKHYIVAKNKKEWIDKTSILLKDAALREKLGNEAHNLIMEKYQWDIIGKKLLKEIDEVIA